MIFIRTVREHVEERTAREIERHTEHRRDRKRIEQADEIAVHHALLVARAPVLAHERRACGVERHHDIVDDGIGVRRGGIAGHHGRIERVDRRLNEQVRNRKNHVLDACRDAEAQDAPDLVAMEPQPLKIEFAGVVQAHHVPHDEDG